MNNMNGWHPVTLPSLGRFYENLPGGEVEITPWTTAQEEIMIRGSTKTAMDRFKMIRELVQGCTRFPDGFNYGELLVADQHFLLMRLRAVSLMPQYTIDFSCRECGVSSPLSFNLDELEVITPDEGVKEPFTTRLPKSKVSVAVKLMRTKDEEATISYRKKQEDANLPGAKEKSYRFTLARQLVSVDGRDDMKWDEKMDFIGGLHLLDLTVYKSLFSKNDIGLNMEARVDCPSCGFRPSDWSIPIQLCFFYPKQCDIDAVLAGSGED